MEYQIIVSDKASNMLLKHIAFIARVSDCCQETKDEIIKAIKKLKIDITYISFF